MLDRLLCFEPEMLIRLLVSVILGGIVGWERSGSNHDAGLRTHIIVCLGSASIMVVSECIVAQYGIASEIMRMSAQIISGIGFLGAGSILISGNRIRGITTAAGIWTTACVGIIVGAGYYLIAVFVVFLMMISMLGLKRFAHRKQYSDSSSTLKLDIADRAILKTIIESLETINVEIRDIRISESDDSSLSVILELQSKDGLSKIIACLSGISGISQIEVK